MSPDPFAAASLNALIRKLDSLSLDHRNNTDNEDTYTDMTPIPRAAPTAATAATAPSADALVSLKVKKGLAQVKQRCNLSKKRHQTLAQQYQAIPDEVRTSQSIDLESREECHSEFASTGMYEGVISMLCQYVKEAEEEFAKSDLEACFESLRSILEILIPIEKNLDMYEKAMKLHEEEMKSRQAHQDAERKRAKNKARSARAKKRAKILAGEEEEDHMDVD